MDLKLEFFVTIMCHNEELSRTMSLLKYGFCKKSLRKNASLTSWTLFSSQKGTCSIIQVPFCEEKSVQLVRVAFFVVTSYKIHTLADTKMKVERMGITEILRRIWLFSANKIKSSESSSKQQPQLIVKLNSSLRHIIVTKL